ncbi:MAG: thymidylate synthase [Mariprofundus sp.]|nr:thymidylate synthase [Mariprofundus sp.]
MASAPAMAEVKSSTDKIVGAFMELDADASESISFEEYKAMVDQRAMTRFKEMDANRDGQVTDEEYRKFWAENKARWYRLQR